MDRDDRDAIAPTIRDERALARGVDHEQAGAGADVERRDALVLVAGEHELTAVGIEHERAIADRGDARAGELRRTTGVLARRRDVADELEAGRVVARRQRRVADRVGGQERDERDGDRGTHASETPCRPGLFRLSPAQPKMPPK